MFPVFKVLAANNAEELSQQSMDGIELLDECGFKKPITTLKLEDKDELIRAVTLHSVLLKSLAEVTQFRDGLSALSVQESMKKNPNIFMPYYCLSESDALNSGTYIVNHICHAYFEINLCMFYADKLRNLFTDIRYSRKGSSIRIREEIAFTYFIDYLDDCEVSLTTLQLCILMSTVINSFQLMH